MKSLKITPEERAAQVYPEYPEDNNFPYGTRIHMCPLTLAALGVVEIPAAGSIVEFHAKGVVVSANVTTEGKASGMGIQITEMDKPTVVKGDAATMYGE